MYRKQNPKKKMNRRVVRGIVPNRAISTQCPRQPPKYQACLALKQKFRFIFTGTGSTAVTTQDLMSLLYFNKGDSTSPVLASLLSAIRVRKLYLWSPGICSIEFQTVNAGNTGAKPAVFSDVGVGATYVGALCVAPPYESSAAQWQSVIATNTTTTGVVMLISGVQTAILDIVLDIVLNNGDPPYAVTLASQTTAPNANMIGLNYADSSSPTPLLQPLDYYPNNVPS